MKNLCPNCLHENFSGNKYCITCHAILKTPSLETVKAALKTKRNIPYIPILALTLIVLVLGTIITASVVRFALKNESAQKKLEEVKRVPVFAGETEVEGQMFIVTKGAGNYKLGLVTIFFFRGSEPVASVKTDADGKFSIKIPRGEYIIQAASSRKIFDDTEFYKWNLPVKLTEAKHQIFLSNDNLTSE
ncbi:MAG TPA: hypothetical protein VIL74_07525 [Pyrinomonadaceae bacterium]|jgi:hypothetical protein